MAEPVEPPVDTAGWPAAAVQTLASYDASLARLRAAGAREDQLRAWKLTRARLVANMTGQVVAVVPDGQTHRGGPWDCAMCRAMLIEQHGGLPGLCMLCGGEHWPWEPHEQDRTGPGGATSGGGYGDGQAAAQDPSAGDAAGAGGPGG